MRVGPWPDLDTDWARNENPLRYGLDVTHPGAAEWLFNLTDKLANQWGYEMIKIDFVAWSLLSATSFMYTGVTPAQAYRKGYEIMRSAAGEKCHLLECGPGQVSTGLINSMRIELDQNYGYGEDAWKQYFLHSSSSDRQQPSGIIFIKEPGSMMRINCVSAGFRLNRHRRQPHYWHLPEETLFQVTV